ncbi:M23 family metallopeptidase [Thiolapillus brandeum]|uniref:Peptidase M23 n=1 Tax=Thiolapillus brandeum TaxID=1076588 RepID=A0A7U6GH36_9GAMM|nr:M23 family metallopeptidase [Thiolapillus brandeum]BAO43512.1 peptidase M23 [Thiolapillus brandeum]
MSDCGKTNNATPASFWSVRNGLVLMVFVGLALFSGYQYGRMQAVQAAMDQDIQAAMASMAEEKRELAALRDNMEAELDALALRIGSLRANLLRLNALGERLVAAGNLDEQEFDFSSEPPQGGVDMDVREPVVISDLERELARLTQVFRNREHKLLLLEDMLASREVRDQVIPSGRPLKHGYISSGFGRRTDPFTGKKKYHKGIDFAGKKGSEVLAVAAGVVSRAGRMSGYGNVVEIRHADGYVTRYAHNQENLVKAGDRVEKGEPIAMLGSTGRSSGPHVHFEVIKNDKVVNPARFIRGG